MASYPAVIDLKVTGLKDLDAIKDKVRDIQNIQKQLKPVQSIFGGRLQTEEIRRAKKELSDYVIEVGKGGKNGRAFASTLAGLNQQIKAFGAVAGNSTTGSEQFTQALNAAERASIKLKKAEAERLKVLNRFYTPSTVGRAGSVKEILELGKVIPKSISGLEFYQSELQETLRLVNIGSKDFTDLSLAIADVNEQLARTRDPKATQGPKILDAKGFWMSPLGPKSRENTTASRQKLRLREDLATGVGFPLLFGGGPGSVAGGALGAFLGGGKGGFGLQILFSAIGAQLDEAFKTLQDIGNAVNTIDVDRLVQANIRINAELREQLSQLERIGDVEKARELVSDRVAEVTGTIPGTTEDIANAVNLLGAAWNGVVKKASTFLGIVGAPLAVALAAVFKFVDLTLNTFNLMASAVAKILKTLAGWFIGDVAVRAIENALKSVNGQFDEANAKAAELARTLGKDAVKATRVLEVESQLTLGLTPEQRIADIDTRLREELRQIEDKARETREKVLTAYYAGGGTAEAEEAKDRGLKEARTIEGTSKAVARLRADREKTLIIIREGLNINKATTAEAIKQSKLENKMVALAFGRKGAIEDELENLSLMTDLKIRQVRLSNEEQSVQDKKIETLQLEERVRRRQLEVELEKLRVQKELNALQRAQKLTGVRRGLEQELAGLALPTGNVFADPFIALERQQGNRRQNVITPLQNQISQLDLQYAGATNLEERTRIFGEIEAIEKQIALYDQLLPQISEAERTQLAYNQALSQVQGPVNSLVNGFRDVVAGTKSAQEAFADFLNTIADQLIQTAATMIAQYIAIGIARAFALGGTPTPPSLNLSGVQQYSGVGADSFVPLPRANGGPVSTGRPYMVGERGPELFVPRSSGTIVPNDKMGGGASNVVVNVDATGSKVEGDNNQASQLGKVIGAAVQAELVKQKRPGGLLAGV